MANIDLKFICSDSIQDYIQVKMFEDESTLKKDIGISGRCNGNYFDIFLDKSTAIKFAKTLRTEINKIKEQ